MLAGLLDFLFPPRKDEEVVRDCSLDEFLKLLSPHSLSYTRPETITLLPFKDKRVKAAIHEAKYRGSEDGLRLLSGALAEYLRESDETLGTRVLVPIPLGSSRRRERGFNQVEEVAKRVAKELGIQIEPALTRTRETVSQVSLPRRERLENMRGAFGAAFPLSPNTTYIVLDDVITTGATLQAAIDALAAGGAAHIIPLALTH